jgi:hypothetical protein
MEGVDFDEFKRDNENLKNNYLELTKNHTYFFDNYYTQNQDSRTSIFSMLHSLFIPYESYSDYWEGDYRNFIQNRVLENKSLLNFFKNNGYKNYALFSSTKSKFITDFLDWDKIYKLTKKERKKIIEKKLFVCLTVYQYEPGCEDLAVFEKLKNIVLNKSKEKKFIFHEFIFGHGFKYNQITKKHNYEYYNNFLIKFFKFLKKNNLTKDYVIVVLSDHGRKGLRSQIKMDTYKIPLMIFNTNIEKFKKIQFPVSHLNLAELLILNLNNKSIEKNYENLNFIMGSSTKNLLSYIKNDKKFIVKIKDSEILLLNKKNIEILEIHSKLNEFFSYKNYYEKININYR